MMIHGISWHLTLSLCALSLLGFREIWVQLQDTSDQLPAGQPEEEEVTVAYQRDVAERLQKFFEARETYK